MAKKQAVLKEKIKEPEEHAPLVDYTLGEKVSGLMNCGFTYEQATSWIRKQNMSELFNKDERILT